MPEKDLISVLDLKPGDIKHVVARASQLTSERSNGILAGKTVALLFEKPSLRTKASFQVAVHQLGGQCFYMGPDEVQLGVRETVSDVARVLSRYVDCIVARVYFPCQLTRAGTIRLCPCNQRSLRLGAPVPDPCRLADHPST